MPSQSITSQLPTTPNTTTHLLLSPIAIRKTRTTPTTQTAYHLSSAWTRTTSPTSLTLSTYPSPNHPHYPSRTTNAITSEETIRSGSATHPAAPYTDTHWSSTSAPPPTTPTLPQAPPKTHPGYWPERRPSTPPLHNSPIAATISDAQLSDDWVRFQLPWHEFRHRIPALTDKPDALCAPPSINRLYPPHQYLLDHQQCTPDQLGVNDRTSHFYQSDCQSWTQYLLALPPMVRRYYQTTLPPSTNDYPPTNPTSTTPLPYLGGYSKPTTSSLPPTPNRKRQRTTPPTSDSDPEGYSRNNQFYEEPYLPPPPRIITPTIHHILEQTLCGGHDLPPSLKNNLDHASLASQNPHRT